MTFRTTPLTPNYGVEVHDIDLTQINGEIAEALLDAVNEHALLLFRRQSLHDEDIYALSAALGPVEEPAAKINHSPRFKEVNYISNLNNSESTFIGAPITDNDGGWHTDQAFRKNPATLSTLFCIIAPEKGGGTSFCSTHMGYEALPETLKKRIENMRVKYLPGKIHEVEPFEVTHPLVLTSPSTGRKTLYISPGTRGIDGLAEAESQTLKNELLTYQLRQHHIYQHNYRMGDMLIYDNAQLLHKRDAYKGPRFLKITRVFLSPDRFAIPD